MTKLAMLMKAYSFTMADVASKAGTTVVTVFKYVKGKSKPTPHRAEKIAAVFGLPVSEVFDEVYYG